jgi:hypothetical protein
VDRGDQPERDREGQAQDAVRDDERHERGEERDGRACGEHREPSALGERLDERVPGAQAHTREEEHEAELSQRDARSVRERPHERPRAAELAEEETHHERAACDAEAEREAHGQRDRELAEREAEHDAEAERQHVELSEGGVRVAEELRQLGHPCARRDHPHPIAELELGRIVGQELDVSASHARHRRAEALEQVEVREWALHDVVSGDEDAAEVEHFAVELEVLGAGGAEELLRPT